jgi:hypothetical protein
MFYDGIEIPQAASYQLLFFVRRIVVVFSLVYIDLFSAQILINQLMSILMVIFLMKYRPMTENCLQRNEFINESAMIFITDSLFLCTDWVTTPTYKYDLGWIYIGIFCSLFAYNLFFFLNNTLVNMIRDCLAKRKREKQKQAKIEA